MGRRRDAVRQTRRKDGGGEVNRHARWQYADQSGRRDIVLRSKPFAWPPALRTSGSQVTETGSGSRWCAPRDQAVSPTSKGVHHVLTLLEQQENDGIRTSRKRRTEYRRAGLSWNGGRKSVRSSRRRPEAMLRLAISWEVHARDREERKTSRWARDYLPEGFVPERARCSEFALARVGARHPTNRRPDAELSS